MSTLIADMTMSVDGFVAFKNDDPGPIFEWYTTGPVEIETANPGVTLRTDAKLFADVEELRWRGPTNAFAACVARIGDARLAQRVDKHATRP